MPGVGNFGTSTRVLSAKGACEPSPAGFAAPSLPFLAPAAPPCCTGDVGAVEPGLTVLVGEVWLPASECSSSPSPVHVNNSTVH
jgi:hypothetical protein